MKTFIQATKKPISSMQSMKTVKQKNIGKPVPKFLPILMRNILRDPETWENWGESFIENYLRYELPQDFFYVNTWTENNITRSTIAISCEYENSPTVKHLDVMVIKKHIGGWKGKHKNVKVWWELENGRSVGWNENPSVGWSFPVMMTKK